MARGATTRRRSAIGARALGAAALALALTPPAGGLYITRPCCSQLPHLPAGFGPSFNDVDGVGGVLRETGLLCDESDVPDGAFDNAVALVARGACRFVDKVLLAQRKGATAVIVYNDEVAFGSGDDDSLVKMSVVDPEEAVDVVIPAVFISLRSFDQLEELAEAELSTSKLEIEVYINGTGALDMEDFDTGPLITESFLFMMQLMLLLWTGVALVNICKFVKAKAAKRRRLDTVRKLPTRVFRSLPAGQPGGTLVEVDLAKSADPSAPRHPRHRDMHAIPSDDTEVELTVVSLGEPSPRSAHASSSALAEGGAGAASAPSGVEPGAGAAAAAGAASSSSPSAAITDYFSSESCVVCLCSFEDGETITVLPCGHGYHKECIEPWLITKSALCPICKQSILPSGDSRSLSEISDDQTGTYDEAAHTRSLLILILGIVAMAIATSSMYFYSSGGD